MTDSTENNHYSTPSLLSPRANESPTENPRTAVGTSQLQPQMESQELPTEMANLNINGEGSSSEDESTSEPDRSRAGVPALVESTSKSLTPSSGVREHQRESPMTILQTIWRTSLDNEYEQVRNLGTMGGVCNDGMYLVRRRRDQQLFVQKKLPKEDSLENKMNEILIHRRLRHESILRYVDSFITPEGESSIYTEYCNQGDLERLIRAHWREGKLIPERFIRHTFTRLADALAYCHFGVEDATPDPMPDKVPGWLTVLHRDLKPSNVFLKFRPGETYPAVVLADFGHAIREDDFEYELGAQSGAYIVRPPEQTCGPEGDIWAVGAIIQMMCRLDKGPLVHSDRPRGMPLSYWVTNTDQAYRPRGAGPDYTNELNQVLWWCQQISPALRPDAVGLANCMRMIFNNNPVPQSPLEHGLDDD